MTRRGRKIEEAPRPFPPVSRWRLAAIAVIGLVPIIGIMFLDWSPLTVVALYAIETLVAGGLTFLRLVGIERARPDERLGQRRPTEAFVRHFGLFAVFFVAITAGMILLLMPRDGFVGIWRLTLGEPAFRLTILAIGVLAAFEIGLDWVLPKAWRTAEVRIEFSRPYNRILPMYLLLSGGFGMLFMIGSLGDLVIILCVIKLVMDLALEFAGEPFVLEFGPKGEL